MGNKFGVIIVLSIISLFVGLLMWEFAYVKTEYQTLEYGIAKDLEHVYDRSTGQIVDNITNDEEVKMEEGVIVVVKENTTLAILGFLVSASSVAVMVYMISLTEWWERVKPAILGKKE